MLLLYEMHVSASELIPEHYDDMVDTHNLQDVLDKYCDCIASVFSEFCVDNCDFDLKEELSMTLCRSRRVHRPSYISRPRNMNPCYKKTLFDLHVRFEKLINEKVQPRRRARRPYQRQDMKHLEYRRWVSRVHMVLRDMSQVAKQSSIDAYYLHELYHLFRDFDNQLTK